MSSTKTAEQAVACNTKQEEDVKRHGVEVVDMSFC
jgi:hypothetical protein